MQREQEQRRRGKSEIEGKYLNTQKKGTSCLDFGKLAIYAMQHR